MKDHSYRVYAVVRQIPYGRVATYGQIADMAGLGGQAREVGYMLFDVPADSEIPWHRVINARGEISARSIPGGEDKQRLRLEEEGVKFDEHGRISLQLFGWMPLQPTKPEAQGSLW
jgi:methylated-DNA-protein-cysteine methyltransferase-like protein